MKTKIVAVLSILCLGVLVFGVLSSPVSAQAPSGQPTAQQTPFPWKEKLAPVRETLAALPTPDGKLYEDLLVREKLALSNQQTRLNLSQTVAATYQEFIDQQKQAGKDTSALESALTAFNQAIVQAKDDNAAAATLLANPAGFDASGNVTDMKTARDTVHNAGQSLRQAHLTITQATVDLRRALKTYRGK